jgi:hypothetical protein
VSEVGRIGLDSAKNVFQAHGADASGKVLFRKKIVRTKLIRLQIHDSWGLPRRGADLILCVANEGGSPCRGRADSLRYPIARSSRLSVCLATLTV